MSAVSLPKVADHSVVDVHSNSQVGAKPHESSSNHTEEKGKKGPPKKRDTHFLCFPLVTDTSVPQLAESLRYFRGVSTKPTRSAVRNDRGASEESNLEATASSTSQPQSTEVAGDSASDTESNANLSNLLPLSNNHLQILPAIVHRPAGTFHLTLGVMDLSRKEEMDRALTLLQELDYAELFGEVSSQREVAQPRRGHHGENAGNDQPTQEPEVPDEVTDRLTSLHTPVSPPSTSDISQDSAASFSAHHPPQISLTGLSTFPAAKTSRVFFAKPTPVSSAPFPLLQFGQAIRRKFREADFITETRPLVLHATVANMKYATQARGGRTSKGKAWRYGKERWTDGQVDAREIIKCFDYYGGDVEAYVKGSVTEDDKAQEFVWAKDIMLNTVAICKMGAEKSDDELLGQVYPPIGEKAIFL